MAAVVAVREIGMSVVSGRMAARQRALAAQQNWRKEHAAREKRRQAWAVAVAVAIGEREETIARCDQAAGEALVKLVRDGLSVEDAITWAGGGLSVKQARGLIAAVSAGAVVEPSDDAAGGGA